MREKLNATKSIRFLLIFVAMVLALSVSVCAATSKKTVRFKVKPTTVSATIKVGDKLTLVLKDGVKTVTSKAKYTSSKRTVATVSKKGVITAKKKGNTVITAKYKKKVIKIKLTVDAKNSRNGGKKTGTNEDEEEHGEIKIRRVGTYENYYHGVERIDVVCPLVSYKATEIVTKPDYYRVTLTVEATYLHGIDYVVARLKDTVLGDVYEGRLTEDEVFDLKHGNLVDIPINAPVPAGEYDLFVDIELSEGE